MNYFVKNLKYLLQRFAVKQSEIAFQIGKSQNSISNWTREVSSPDINDLIGIHQFFGISLDVLIFQDLENGNLISDEMVKKFTPNGNLNGNLTGNLIGKKSAIYRQPEPPVSMVAEHQSLENMTIIGQLTIIDEKLNQLLNINKLQVKGPRKK